MTYKIIRNLLTYKLEYKYEASFDICTSALASISGRPYMSTPRGNVKTMVSFHFGAEEYNTHTQTHIYIHTYTHVLRMQYRHTYFFTYTHRKTHTYTHLLSLSLSLSILSLSLAHTHIMCLSLYLSTYIIEDQGLCQYGSGKL